MSNSAYGKYFVSYNRNDEDKAIQLVQRLKSVGLDCWRDNDDIFPADIWGTEIESAITSCKALILLVSEKSLISQWVIYEWAWAHFNKKPIIQLDVEPISSAARHSVLQRLESIQFPDTDEAWNKFVLHLHNQYHQSSMTLMRHNLWDKSNSKKDGPRW